MKQSFICPCFNEENNVIAFAKAVLDAFPNTKDYELVFINDGSADNTIGELKKLKKESFLLVDSGGQYLDGTTDITRTIPLGPLTKEERHIYTLVLKGHIQLEIARFLQGCSGQSLDILARTPLWEKGFDYNHGTGHGVG